MKLTPEYLAGFFDGEGCIDCQTMYAKPPYEKRFYVRPRIRLAQAPSGFRVLDQLKQDFGGHVGKERQGRGNQSNSKSWEILNKKGIIEMLELLEPLLVIKQEQARLCLWWFKNCAGKNGLPEAARRQFAEQLQLMKRDPQRLSGEAIAQIEQLMR